MAVESMTQPLRKCTKCGKEANNEIELDLFIKSKKSIFGRANLCKLCSYADRTKGGIYCKKRDNSKNRGNKKRTSKKMGAHYLAEKLPIAELCELCPESDKRIATQRHHPDYNYPTIFVSCCDSCHKYAEYLEAC